MKRALNLLLAMFVLGSSHAASSSMAYPQTADQTIASRSAEVHGVKLHYLTAGHGMTLILLHGYAQTSRMWNPIIPAPAHRFTVIAPDLPGIGVSGEWHLGYGNYFDAKSLKTLSPGSVYSKQGGISILPGPLPMP